MTLTLSHIDVHHWNSAYSANCTRYNFLEVRDGRAEDAPVVGRFCDASVPPAIVSTVIDADGMSFHFVFSDCLL